MKSIKETIAPFLVGVAITSVASVSLAAPGDGGVGQGISVLTNPEMATIRGKYVVAADTVLYFGVEMASVWRTQDGQQLQGGARLGLDFSGGASPTVSFTPTVSILSGTGRGTAIDTSNRTVSSSGIDNVTGLGQSIQVAGDYNTASNTLSVRLLDKLPENRGQGVGESLSVTDGAGGSATATLNDKGMMVTLSLDGQGVVQQSIRGALRDGARTGNGAFQSIKTLGDSHTISNRMQLSILMKPRAESANLSKTLGVSLGGLRGL